MLNRNNNAMTSYNPFHDMDNFEKHFFADPFGFFGNHALEELKTDVADEGDHYRVDMDMPGFAKDDIHLDINNDVLTVRAERHSEHEEDDKKGKYLRCERSYGSYSRSFDVSNIQAEAIKAKYADGVLTLSLPKKQASAPVARRVEIE